MTGTHAKPFDFDEWKDLAASDPQAFESRRREIIERRIRRAPEQLQRRLRGLQWKIDIVRQRYKDPRVSSAKLFEMMWEQVYGRDGFLQALTKPAAPAATQATGKAEVIPLSRRRQGI